MEVGGKKPDKDLPKSSDQELPPHCEPCSNEGEHLPAKGFCETCAEHLCETCYKVHTIPKPMRYHVLLDQKHMPLGSSTTKTKPKQSLCTIRCTDHPEEIVKYYCQPHDSVLCGVCAVLEHKTCAVTYIPDLKYAQAYKETPEYTDLVNRIESVEQNTQAVIIDVSENQTSNEEAIETAIHDIREFRKKINIYIDSREKRLLKDAKEMRQEDRSIQKKLVTDLQTLRAVVGQSKNAMSSHQNEMSDLFVASKQIRQQVTQFEKSLQEYAVENKTPDYTFRKKEDLERILSSNGVLGTIERSYMTRHLPLSMVTDMTSTLDFKSVKLTRLPVIKMKTTGDVYQHRITGLTLLQPNTLLAVDYNNSSLKSVDTTNNTVTSKLSFIGTPWDITLLPGDQAAVTIPDQKQIQVISTKGRYSCLRSISVNGTCHGICSTDQNIVVSFKEPAMIQVMDCVWNVVNTISKDDTGTPLFQQSYCITVSMEDSGEMIYVSDRVTDTITKVSLKGKVISTYIPQNRKRPSGLICVGQGQLLVSDSLGDTVDVVSDDGKDVITLLDRSYGLHYPMALCYCTSLETLYISSASPVKPILVFKVSQK